MIQARNQRNEKVVIQVKEKFGKIVAKTIEISAKAACNSTSWVGLYQPAVPKQLKSAKKSEKK